VETHRPRKSTKQTNPDGRIAVYTSIAAIVLSLVSGLFTYFVSLEGASTAAIKDEYQVFFDFTKATMERSLLAHIFALPNQYDFVSKQVHTAASGLKPTAHEARHRRAGRGDLHIHCIRTRVF
jgi:hypothetical protein